MTTDNELIQAIDQALDERSLAWAAKWIEDSLQRETNERVIEFGCNMAMTLRAAVNGPASAAPVVDKEEDAGGAEEFRRGFRHGLEIAAKTADDLDARPQGADICEIIAAIRSAAPAAATAAPVKQSDDATNEAASKIAEYFNAPPSVIPAIEQIIRRCSQKNNAQTT